MALPSFLSQKIPTIFSARNSLRKFKIDVKGCEGTIVFTEFAKKDFILMAFMRATKMINKAKELGEKDLLKYWAVDDRQHLKWFDRQVLSYVKDVEAQTKKKIPNFLIYKHELIKMEFEEKQNSVYEVRVLVNIWVSV